MTSGHGVSFRWVHGSGRRPDICFLWSLLSEGSSLVWVFRCQVLVFYDRKLSGILYIYRVVYLQCGLWCQLRVDVKSFPIYLRFSAFSSFLMGWWWCFQLATDVYLDFPSCSQWDTHFINIWTALGEASVALHGPTLCSNSKINSDLLIQSSKNPELL